MPAQMSTSMLRASLISILLALLALPAPLHAQSLADAAKKAEDQRAKTSQEPAKSVDGKETDGKNTDVVSGTKVYSNKDLVEVPHPPAPVSADSKTELAAKDAPNKAE